jgi:type 1 fimbria pilin
MIKKIIGIAIIAFICQAGYGQKSVNQVFNEFSGYADANKISIGGFMMKIAGMFEDTMGVEKIDILNFNDCDNDTKKRFSEAIRSLKDPSFETMINSSENGERVKVMVRIKDETIHELVVLTSGNDPTMVRIKGKIKKSDIERIISQNS